MGSVGDNRLFQDYLFEKHVFAGSAKESGNAFETVFALANLFAIRVTEGAEFAAENMIRIASRCLGENVPASFYRGFPESVRTLSSDELLFDQLAHYAVTYGFGHFGRPGHSVLEEEIPRLAFRENVVPRDFRIVSQQEAESLLLAAYRDLLSSTRPLSGRDYELVSALIPFFPEETPPIASRDTAVRLLLDTRDLRFAGSIDLPDVMRLLGELWFASYGGRKDLNNLSLKNRDRKFVSALLDLILARKKVDERSCFEKKRLWKGFLHSIHYKPKNARAAFFLARIRGKSNESVYSGFEQALASGNPAEAAALIREGKSSAALLRRLDHILSRSKSEAETEMILAQAETENPRVLISLLFHYGTRGGSAARHFVFTHLGLLQVHTETAGERKNRRSRLPENLREEVRRLILSNLARLLHGRLGRVWIDPSMKRIAVPSLESASSRGFGALPSGSRLPLPRGKKVRAFIYWERVDDIDLAVMGLRENGERKEFSWRTMAENQSDAIAYSGDQTAGYRGGSEFFDINVGEFRSLYPRIRYLVFTANVYSDATFSEAFVKAGYMMRDGEDSGAVFEPKTVSSALTVDSPSTFAYLFALDLESMDIIWLNLARGGDDHVAGETGFSFLLERFHSVEVFSLYDLVSLMALETVPDPLSADVIVSDSITAPAGRETIRSFDSEKLSALLDRR